MSPFCEIRLQLLAMRKPLNTLKEPEGPVNCGARHVSVDNEGEEPYLRTS